MNALESRNNFLHENNAKLMWHPMAHAADMQKNPPKILVGASGVEVEDIHGNRVLDAVGGLWNVNLGYSCEPVKQAIAEQLSVMPYCSTFRGSADSTLLDRGRPKFPKRGEVWDRQCSGFLHRNGSKRSQRDRCIRQPDR